jgi:hypothetical protein
MKMDAARWAQILEFRKTHTVGETRERFGLSFHAFSYWRGKFGAKIPEHQEAEDGDEAPPAARTKEPTQPLPSALLDWSYPQPRKEALFLFNATRRGGLGVGAVRRLISIGPQELTELEELVRLGQVSAERVEKAIAFRREVRVEFEKLLDHWCCRPSLPRAMLSGAVARNRASSGLAQRR